MEIKRNVADETLVALYAQGNNEAFDLLLERHKERIYSYIYYNVHKEHVLLHKFAYQHCHLWKKIYE